MILASRHGKGRSFTILTDSQAAMVRLQTDAPGPGQGAAREIIELAHTLREQGNTISVRGSRAIEGSLVTSWPTCTRGRPRSPGSRPRGSPDRDPNQPRLPEPLGHRANDPTTADGHRGEKRRQESIQNTRPRIRPQLRGAPKQIAARYLQLLSGHAMTAPSLNKMKVDGQ